MSHITFEPPTPEVLWERMKAVTPIVIPLEPTLRRAIRVRVGLDMATVARVLGVRPLTVARWEAEGRKPWRRHAEAYGRLLAACCQIASPIDSELKRLAR